MLQIWICLSVLLLKLHSGVHGYMIDGDCGDDTQFIRARVDAAFRMIDNTVTELNRNPINTQVDDWHNTLFGRRFDAQAERHRNIKPRFEDLLVIRTYTTTDQTGIAAPDIRDVRFYCTFKRIEKKGDRYRNKDRDILYKIGNLDSPGGRFANCYDLNPPTLMITLNVLGKHSEIQICPWFLTNVRGYQLKDLSSLPTSAYHLLSKIALPVAAKAVYTPIDSFSLMDKTILHELTHTDQSNPVTVDLGRHPYGFRNARRLAANYVQNNEDDPIRNADSNSLFAVGTWIIAKGGGPINPDGTFQAPQATPKL